MAARKKSRKRNQLLEGYLEKVSWKVLHEYADVIQKMIRRRSGIYALYKKQDRLYYVGLASNLMGRIKNHLKDRHSGAWDRFSVYLTRQDEHVKQLESLVLRIVAPQGNKASGQFGGASNLHLDLHREMANRDADRRARLLGGHVASRRIRQRAAGTSKTLVLKGLVDRRMALRGGHAGKRLNASLRVDGWISYAGSLYASPRAAARAATKRKFVNGWSFWKYRARKGGWVPLSDLKS